MQKAWISLLGILGIVTSSCLGFAMNRSDSEVLGPAIWPRTPFNADGRDAIKIFLNGKIHADVDNILRHTETKKLAKEEEKCSSCSEDSLRVRRSDNIPYLEKQVKIDDRNTSKIKESPTVPSSISEMKTSNATSKSNTSDATSESKTLHVTSELKTSRVMPESKTSHVIPESKTSHVIPESKTSHVIPESKTSHVIPESKTSHVTSESKASDVTSEWKGSDVTSEKSPGSKIPRNVVFLLIDNDRVDSQSAWTIARAAYDFPVHGLLQNCRRTELAEDFKFTLGKSLVSGGKVECECDRFLRANVGSLLSWARHMKDMTTGAVSATNFSIPSPFGYERMPIQVTKDLEDEVKSPKQNATRSHSNLWTHRRLVELQKQSSLSSSTPTFVTESATKVDGANGFDGIWDVFDMFARIRMAFFRILLESLGNLTGSEDEFSGRRPFPVQPSVVELVSDTIRELKSLPNKNGFMMVITTPGNDLSAVIEILQREVSADNTLLVGVGMCSENNERIPFFATGPGGKALQEARTVWELPELIRDVISKNCYGETCKNKRREAPRRGLSPSIGLLSFPDDLPHKRIARANEEDETTSSTGDDKTTKDSEDAENNSDEKTAVPEMEKRSGAEISRVDNVAAILGIATSITAMLALNS